MRLFLSLYFISIFLSFSAQAAYVDSKLPVDKPAQALIDPLLIAFNSGDNKRIKDFILNHFTDEWTGRIDDMMLYFNLLSAVNGELKLHSSRDFSKKLPDSEMVFIVYSQLTESWRAITLITDINQNNRISMFDISPARWPSDLPPPMAISQSSAVKELKAFSHKLTAKDVFSGAILLARGNKILLQQPYGQASKRYNVDNQVDTKFNLASVGKMFTGIAIVQLIQSGKLKATDKLGRFIDEQWLDKSISNKIEIEQLINHTSGLGDSALRSNELQRLSKKTFRQLIDYQPLIKKERLISEPGSQYSYSSTGLFLAGVVIEKVSGMNYFDYIQEHIFKPAAMHDTGFFDMDRPIANLATGYERLPLSKAGWKNNWFEHLIKGTPAGGAVSTIGDMHKFSLALIENRLLNKQMTQKAMGYYSHNENKMVGHMGRHFGINTELVIFPQDGYIAVVLSNYTTGAESMSSKLHQLLKQIK